MVAISNKETVDSIIRADRSIRPVYPDWVREVMHPELETTGPAEYDINNVEQWLHPNQERGAVKGDVIYENIQKTDTLKDHLGLADLLAIQEKGIAFFQKHFNRKAVFGWKSVVRHHNGDLRVPYLFEDRGEVVVFWQWFGSLWSSRGPGLRFAS